MPSICHFPHHYSRVFCTYRHWEHLLRWWGTEVYKNNLGWDILATGHWFPGSKTELQHCTPYPGIMIHTATVSSHRLGTLRNTKKGLQSVRTLKGNDSIVLGRCVGMNLAKDRKMLTEWPRFQPYRRKTALFLRVSAGRVWRIPC